MKFGMRFLFVMAFAFAWGSLYSQVASDIPTLEKQAEKFAKEGNTLELGQCQTKLGFLYKEAGNNSKAISSFLKAIDSDKSLGNENAVQSLYTNIGMIYSEQGDKVQSVTYFKKALTINEKLGKKPDIVAGLLNLAMAQQNAGSFKESNKNLDKVASMAQELNDMVSLKDCYATMSENYDKLGDNTQSKKYFDLASTIGRHLQKEEMKQMASQTKAAEEESSAKEKVIQSKDMKIQKISHEQELTLNLLRQQKEMNVLKDKEFKALEKFQKIRQRNIILIISSLSIILVLVVLFMLFITKQLREKNKANAQLEQSNNQILEQKKEIEHQRDLANIQKKKITDSIVYAQRIQNAVLPPISNIEKALPEHMILFRPRDIVSGDFYWMTEKEGIALIAVVDCTGHGVPGAFMSMLGTAFLNDIINKTTFNRHIRSLNASDILNQLKNLVINSLHQSGKPAENKDGMDIALCIIDFERKHLQFAGAHNPLYIIRNNNLIQLPGDPMPIGVYKASQESFTNHNFELEENDLIYLFSDGYFDQLGGPKGLKMMSATFRSKLLEICEKPMSEQKSLLEEFYDQWRGKRDQMDDVTVVGFKFKEVYKISNVPQFKLWHDKRILIAEDVEINFMLLVEALKPTKAKIFRVENGRDAVEYCKHNELDLVLMDIQMPVMDGIEATRMIKNFKPNLPIIAQTAVGTPEDIDSIMLAGCNDVIQKPIELKTFLSTIRRFLMKPA